MVKFTEILKDGKVDNLVAARIRKYKLRYGGQANGEIDRRKASYKDFQNTYYDLVTDFYEYGWGKSFHFAPRHANESFAASIARHEHYLALKLHLGPGMVAADLGSGVGGPAIEIARFSGARIVGVNNNELQLERAAKRSKEVGIDHLTEWLKCDFMHVDAPDESFDAIFSIESTCTAPDKAGVYGEAFRLLKPGGRLAVYEYCMTDVFSPENHTHQKIKANIEYGGAVPPIPSPHEIDEAMVEVGFELIETRDLAIDPTGIPWYQPLVGSGLSLARVRSSPVGRRVTAASLWVLERMKLVPSGTAKVANFLTLAGDAFAAGGQTGIFTPMYFILARKPEQ